MRGGILIGWCQTVERTLKAHILSLENHIRALTKRASEPTCTTEERNRFQAEILIAEQALASYRTAYELERSMAFEEAHQNQPRLTRFHF